MKKLMNYHGVVIMICYLTMIINAKIIVQSPKRLVELFKKKIGNDKNQTHEDLPGVIDSSYGNFGFIPYGHSMVSTLFYG